MKQLFFNSDRPDVSTNRNISPWLKLALDMGPLFIFFIVNLHGQWFLERIPLFSSFSKPIYPATAIFMIAIVIALIISWIITRHIAVIPCISGIFVLIFGFLTLWLHHDVFIKMKPTVINMLFALVLFGGLVFKKSLLSYVLDSALQLDAEGWRQLTRNWIYFFLFLAILNEIIWRYFSDELWTTFKVFGTVPITILFIIIQTPFIIRHTIKTIDYKASPSMTVKASEDSHVD
ncbi:MAG: intracellular septation protein [Candidatus Tokpelaia sp. JSC085]|nr:MAG: intracellular septation protein [Candidatus Tokpelaia sp. JSC085]